MFSTLKESIFTKKQSYSATSIVDSKNVAKSSLSVEQSAESYQYEQISTTSPSIQDMSFSDSDTYSFARESKIPPYKEAIEFIMSGFFGYTLAVGMNYMTGSSVPNNEILASMLVTAMPYFNGRLTSFVMNTWLSKPETSPRDYKKVVPRVTALLGSFSVGAAMGSLGLFRHIGLKESAFMGSMGLLTGKGIELAISAYQEKRICFKNPEIKLSPRQ